VSLLCNKDQIKQSAPSMSSWQMNCHCNN